MSPSPNPKTMPEVAAVASAGDAAVPHLPEDGMKRLKTLMTDLLAENVGIGEKEVEARLLSLLWHMRAYTEALVVKKQNYFSRMLNIKRSVGATNSNGVIDTQPCTRTVGAEGARCESAFEE